MGGKGSKLKKKDDPKKDDSKKDEPKAQDSAKPQEAKQKTPEESKPEEESKPSGDQPVGEDEFAEIEAKGGGKGKKRRGSVIDELNALERTKSYNKIEEVAGALPEDVRVLTPHQKEELWDFYDKDKNGRMDMDEIKTVMRHLMRYRAKHATRQERKSIELRAMIMTPYQLEDFNEENLAKRVFDSLSVEHNGQVERADFLAKFNLDHEACRVS